MGPDSYPDHPRTAKLPAVNAIRRLIAIVLLLLACGCRSSGCGKEPNDAATQKLLKEMPDRFVKIELKDNKTLPPSSRVADERRRDAGASGGQERAKSTDKLAGEGAN
jgi:hypothetical protein